QLVRFRRGRADLIEIIALDAAAAPLPGEHDKRAAGREYGLDVLLRLGELGLGAVACDENISGVAVNVRGWRCRLGGASTDDGQCRKQDAMPHFVKTCRCGRLAPGRPRLDHDPIQLYRIMP